MTPPAPGGTIIRSVAPLLRGCVPAVALVLALSASSGEAHKPITSPYTFNEDVFPILRDRCGRCHVAGGAAPMSLMTHQETVPWGESLRLELIAGHMPPWSATTTAGRFRHTPALSARELNTLLTWASGGTPPGDDAKAPPPVVLDRSWRLGPPDLVLPLPEFTLGADVQEQVAEFAIVSNGPPDGAPRMERRLRAIDLMPGTPAIVRSATVDVRPDVGPAFRQPILLWHPGDEPVALDEAAFRLPAGGELVVKVRYRKTWEYERQVMTDRSSIGLYFTDVTTPARSPVCAIIRADLITVGVAPNPSARRETSPHLNSGTFLSRSMWIFATETMSSTTPTLNTRNPLFISTISQDSFFGGKILICNLFFEWNRCSANSVIEPQVHDPSSDRYHPPRANGVCQAYFAVIQPFEALHPTEGGFDDPSVLADVDVQDRRIS
jgi:hypothetical protein